MTRARSALATLALVAGVGSWTAAAVAAGWKAPAFDLSALVTGAEVQRTRPEALFEHDPVFYNVATTPAFLEAARRVGFSDVPTPFVHPPLLARLLRPLVWVSFPTVVVVWTFAAIVAFGVSFALMGRRAFPKHDPRLVMGALFAGLTAFEPTLYALWLGQTTPFILLLCVLALVVNERWPRAAGLCLAAAIFVKLTPVFLLIPWLKRRDWRALSGVAIGLSVLVTLSFALNGVAPHLQYASRIREISQITLCAFNNQSLAGVLQRAIDPTANVFEWRMFAPPAAASLATKAATVLGCGAVYFVAPGRGDAAAEGRRDLATVLAILVMLLMPTISWTHYFVFLVPCALLLAARGAAAHVPRALAWLPAASLVLLLRPVAITSQRFGPGPFEWTWTHMAVAVLHAAVALVIWWRTRQAGPAVA